MVKGKFQHTYQANDSTSQTRTCQFVHEKHRNDRAPQSPPTFLGVVRAVAAWNGVAE